MTSTFRPKYDGMLGPCHRCKARCWVIEVGRGLLSRVVAHSTVGCRRHDRAAYEKALLFVEDGQALRFRRDFDTVAETEGSLTMRTRRGNPQLDPGHPEGGNAGRS